MSEKEDNTNNNNKNVLATFVSNFAAMAFGKNLIMEDGGIFLQDGVCGCPDLLVTNLSRNEIIYSVVFVSVDIQIFHVTEEMLTNCLVNSLLVKPTKGCLLVLFSDSTCVVYSVDRDDKLGEKMIKFVRSYVKMPQCLKKRSQEMTKETEILKLSLFEKSQTVVTLGSYPLVEKVIESSSGRVLSHFVQPKTTVISNKTVDGIK